MKLFSSLAIATLISLSTMPPCLALGQLITSSSEFSLEKQEQDETLSSVGRADKQLVAYNVARLDFSWRSAPSDYANIALQLIFNGTSEDFMTLATLLLFDYDLYVVRARLSNSGNVPLRVYPQNVVAYYGNNSTRVVPLPNSYFLQPDILEPNYYIEKPVAFVAPRGLTNFRVGYSDQSIQVRY